MSMPYHTTNSITFCLLLIIVIAVAGNVSTTPSAYEGSSMHIEKDKLRNLRGVSVKILFLWVDIVEVVRKGDNLQFSVGIASAGFSIDNFYECPQCGCGLDCNSLGDHRENRESGDPLVSSS
ncbi:hypothetical protein LIER_40873 [Lithospermum erythrorhizon]|uniref:Transmembrane protein n=1 Tax=Lithospermum erythrorhizon TaxID=34254 RepID=A0AAV3R333_LITER